MVLGTGRAGEEGRGGAKGTDSWPLIFLPRGRGGEAPSRRQWVRRGPAASAAVCLGWRLPRLALLFDGALEPPPRPRASAAARARPRAPTHEAASRGGTPAAEREGSECSGAEVPPGRRWRYYVPRPPPPLGRGGPQGRGTPREGESAPAAPRTPRPTRPSRRTLFPRCAQPFTPLCSSRPATIYE